MRRYLIAGVFGVLASLVGDEAIAQGVQKSAPPNPVAVNAAHDHKKPRAIALSPRQVELVRQVSGYFNQLTILKGPSRKPALTASASAANFISCDPGAFALSSRRRAEW